MEGGGVAAGPAPPFPLRSWPRPRSAHLWNPAQWPARPVAAPVPGHARCRARAQPPRPAAAELCQVCEELARTGRGHGEPPPPPARDSEPAPRPGRAWLLRRCVWRNPFGGGRSARSGSGAIPGRSGCTRTPWWPPSPRDARHSVSSWALAWSIPPGGPGRPPSSQARGSLGLAGLWSPPLLAERLFASPRALRAAATTGRTRAPTTTRTCPRAARPKGRRRCRPRLPLWRAPPRGWRAAAWRPAGCRPSCERPIIC